MQNIVNEIDIRITSSEENFYALSLQILICLAPIQTRLVGVLSNFRICSKDMDRFFHDTFI